MRSHLVTIGSEAENNFLSRNFPSVREGSYWVGGYQPEGTGEPSDGWEWVTGEPFVYSAWGDGEPNDAGNDEDHLDIWIRPGVDAGNNWNDNHGFSWMSGYVVECEVVDADGDGVPDDLDACPDSATSATVMTGEVDTGVANSLLENGCSMTDLIAALAATSERKGEFVSGVAELANAWHAAGLIEGRDQGALLSAAARAGRR